MSRVHSRSSTEPSMSLAGTLELLVKARECVAEGEEYLVDQRKVETRL